MQLFGWYLLRRVRLLVDGLLQIRVRSLCILLLDLCVMRGLLDEAFDCLLELSLTEFHWIALRDFDRVDVRYQ